MQIYKNKLYQSKKKTNYQLINYQLKMLKIENRISEILLEELSTNWVKQSKEWVNLEIGQ